MSDTNARDATAAGLRPERSVEKQARRMLCGDIDIRIARDGTWYHEGGAIRRKPLVKLFASVLTREESGDYYLVTPAEKRRITVEDAPFVAVELSVEGEGAARQLSFRTNVDDVVAAGPEHPIRVVVDGRTGEPAPYVHVRDGLEALIVRSVYYQLVGLGRLAEIEGREVLGVESGGEFFILGQTADDA